MGLPSDDIDIALDDMMGEEFAHKVKELLDSKQMECSDIGVIKANPEKSKHLETATIHILK